MRLVGARDDEQAGGVAVEAVHDPRPVLVAARRRRARSGRARASRVAWPAPGWTTIPAGLSTTSRCSSSQATWRFIDSASSGGASAGSSTTTSSPPLQPVALRPGLAVDEDCAAGDQPLGERPRAHFRPGGDRAVEALGLRGAKSESCQLGGAGASLGRPRQGLRRGGDADDDEDVGEVERGPVTQVEEIRHVAEPDAVDEIRDAAAEHEAERDREYRMSRTGAREEDEHPEHRDAPSARSRRSAREKRPNAIPELWTWWIENGPAIWTSSPSESALATTCFVSWSAPTAAAAMAARPNHWLAPARAAAPRPRSGAARSSTTRRGRRRQRRGELTPGAARSPGQLPRVVDAQRRPGNGFEPLDRDLLAADRAGAVCPRLDPLERLLDLAQLVARVLLETLVELALVGLAWPCPPGGCRRSRTPARRLLRQRRRCRCRDARSCFRIARGASSSSSWKWSVSMVIRSGSPARPPWRAVARSLRPDTGQLDDLVSASRRPKRASRSNAGRRASRRAARGRPRWPSPLRRRGDTHLPGLTVPTDDAGGRRAGGDRSRNRVVGPTTQPISRAG